MKIYTKRGDKGETDLLNNRVSKKDIKIKINGEVDELMAYLFLTKIYLSSSIIAEDLDFIYQDLFNIAHEVALNDLNKTVLKEDRIKYLENKIDEYNDRLKPLSNFIKFDKDISSSYLNLCRVKTRSLERSLIEIDISDVILKYVNRLSDYFFIAARIIDET